jgi:O-antigen/teichoic acid export membrane protein
VRVGDGSGAAVAAPSVSAGSRTFRNTALVLSARIASRLIAFVTVVATMNHLHTAGFGTFQGLVSYTALVAVLVDLGFNTLYVREGARHPAEIGRYLSNLISTRLLLSLVALAVLAVALKLAGLETLLLPGFVLMVLTSYSNLLRNTFYALQQLTYEAIAIVLESLVLFALVVYGILSNQGVAYFVWAYVGSYAFSCAYFLVVILVRRMASIRWRLELDFLRRWFWNGLPFALTFVLTTLYFKIDVPILLALKGPAQTGIYSSAYKPFEALIFVPLTLLQVVFPVLSVYHRDAPERLRDAVRRFFRVLVLMGWPLTVGTVILAPGLTHLLRLFPESAPALRILAVGFVFLFVNNAFIGALNSIDRQSLFTYAAGISVVVNVVLNLLLIPPYGFLGAAWATVLTEVGLAIIGWVLTARHLVRVPLLQLSWRPLLAGLVMGAALWPVRDVHGLLLVAVVLGGGAVYLAAALLVKAIDRSDIQLARRSLGLG